MPGVVQVPFPNPYRPVLQSKPGEDYGETVVRYMDEQILGKLLPAEDVAAILVEPIQGEGGYIVPAPGFFPALRELCDRYDILLIVDEVQSGMGRTGKWWAIEHFGVEPDIVCVGKGVASGIPLGAMIARKSVVSWPYGSHGNTYGGNPIACSAALVTIDLIANDFMQNAAAVGADTLDCLEEIKARHPSIGDVRGIGLMLGIEFVKDRQTKEPDAQLRDRVVELAFQNGLLTLGCGRSTIRIAPPLNITRQEMEEGLMILEKAVSIVEREMLVTCAS
jgi:4-aminobutyrate aminotransferase